MLDVNHCDGSKQHIYHRMKQCYFYLFSCSYNNFRLINYDFSIFCHFSDFDTPSAYNRFDLFFLQQKKGWSVGLLPKEKTIRKAIASIVLEGDKDLKKVELVDGEGNILTYEFKQSGK